MLSTTKRSGFASLYVDDKEDLPEENKPKLIWATDKMKR